MLKSKISKIKNFCANFSQYTNEALGIKIRELKIKSKEKGPLSILEEWFAIVQEISFRTLGTKHFDNQLLAGLLLNEGKVVEMKTGEGKTLSSNLPLSLNALSKKGVHAVTVNEYLAERDKNLMGKIFLNLGLSTGLIKNTMTLKSKQENYGMDITYVTNSELVFDFLRNNLFYNLGDLIQRPLNFCLIDEIDSILIDEAGAPLVLSSFKEAKNINKLFIANRLAKILKKDAHFCINKKNKDIYLTSLGYRESKKFLSKLSLHDLSDPWILEILNALRAKYLFHENRHYIILKNQVKIIDEFTGRVMNDKRWGMGLHEAIETKHKIPNKGKSKIYSSITYQNFFPLYPKFCGMSGTAKAASFEFQKIYNLKVICLPTHKQPLRKDLTNLIYLTESSKWKAVLDKSKECFEKGQPILVGTTTIEKSEFLSNLFYASQIPHRILNAKPENIFFENEVIAQAGKEFAVTIATHVAGRGTDIILGGNIAFEIKEVLKALFLNNTNILTEHKDEIAFIKNQYASKKIIFKRLIENLPYSLNQLSEAFQIFYKNQFEKYFPIWFEKNKRVKKLGGLFVLGTDKYESSRIDSQLRGRAGRQGDPGFSQFFLSLEDDFLSAFRIKNAKQKPISLFKDKKCSLKLLTLNKNFEKVQENLEEDSYELRQKIFEFDDAINSQRKLFLNIRRNFLEKNDYEVLFLRCLENKISSKVAYKELWSKLDFIFAKANLYELSLLKNGKSATFLELMDFCWVQYLERMNYIKDTINWKFYGQENLQIEYNLQAIKYFNITLEQISDYMIYCFIR